MRLFFWLRIALVVLLSGIGSACGVRISGPQIVVEEAWARPAEVMLGHGEHGSGESHAEIGSMTAVYLTLRNEGTAPDRLVAVETDVAEAAELHQTRLEGDVARMEPVAGGIPLTMGERLVMQPGGFHIMLIGLKRPLQPGDRFTLTLRFEQSPPLNVEVEVRQ